MRYLIISDLHANWEALEAVRVDAEGRYERICCLGDLVGYGADPNKVTDWVREHADYVIRGNHDKVCCGLEDPVLFNPVARMAVEWTGRVLTEKNRTYLQQLAKGPKELEPFVMVHGSILNEDEYVLDAADAAMQFPFLGGRLIFFGHTHVQGGFLPANGRPSVTVLQADSGVIDSEPGRSELINPGSVGQPRDRRWEAGYAIFDSEARSVEYRRCPYDLKGAQKKIVDAGLPAVLAERLAVGR